jgi:hypothetical protein
MFCSYENHYSKLVENMLKNDLVLRGSVDAVELLIFPSNTLSKNFQSKNSSITEFYFFHDGFTVVAELIVFLLCVRVEYVLFSMGCIQSQQKRLLKPFI